MPDTVLQSCFGETWKRFMRTDHFCFVDCCRGLKRWRWLSGQKTRMTQNNAECVLISDSAPKQNKRPEAAHDSEEGVRKKREENGCSWRLND